MCSRDNYNGQAGEIQIRVKIVQIESSMNLAKRRWWGNSKKRPELATALSRKRLAMGINGESDSGRMELSGQEFIADVR